MLDITEVTANPVPAVPDAPSFEPAAAMRLLNVHRAGPGEEALRRAATALRGGHRLELESAPAPLRRLIRRFGARALVFQPDVHAYELAALWELGSTKPQRLDERLAQLGVRRLAFDRGDVESHIAAACAALEMALEEPNPKAKELLLRIAHDNAQRAKTDATYRGRAAGMVRAPQ